LFHPVVPNIVSGPVHVRFLALGGIGTRFIRRIIQGNRIVSATAPGEAE
jgi:hypothetical protein